MARIWAIAFPAAVSRRASSATEAPPSALGRTTPSGWAGSTAARSRSQSIVSSGLIRTQSGAVALACRKAATCRLASAFTAGATESSRSRMIASAPAPSAFAIRSGRSPGTKRSERSFTTPPEIGDSYEFPQQENWGQLRIFAPEPRPKRGWEKFVAVPNFRKQSLSPVSPAAPPHQRRALARADQLVLLVEQAVLEG